MGASSRLARAADADPGKSKKKSKRKNKKASKKNKSRRKNKKASKKKKKSKRKNKKASKKDKKSKRKNKKASKKEKKSKRKNNRASKKSKSKRKNKKNKSKKSRQNKRKSRKNSRKSKSQKKNREGEREVPDTCVTTAVNALYNGLSKKAANFDRQSKRIETRLPKIANKLAKASDYNATLDDLKKANASGCPAGNVTELDALVAILEECQTNIETACADPEYNKTQVDECKPIVEGFVSEVEKCFGS